MSYGQWWSTINICTYQLHNYYISPKLHITNKSWTSTTEVYHIRFIFFIIVRVFSWNSEAMKWWKWRYIITFEIKLKLQTPNFVNAHSFIVFFHQEEAKVKFWSTREYGYWSKELKHTTYQGLKYPRLLILEKFQQFVFPH